MSIRTLNRPRASFLRDYQARVVRHLLIGCERDHPATFTVMFPRQAGKNETAATLVAALLRRNALSGGTVVVCAPTFEPQGRISFERTRGVLAATDHLVPVAHEASGNRLRVGNAEAVFLAASPQANTAGHTASIALIADEAQDIDADWFNRTFRPMAASTAAPTIMFGTAWDGQTLLEQHAERNRERIATQPQRFHRHYEVSWQEVAKCVPAYGRYVRAERQRLGANHPLYLTQYELRPAEAAGQLLSAAALAAIEGDFPRETRPRGGRYIAGIDFAGDGDRATADSTIVTIGRIAGERVEVVEMAQWTACAYSNMTAEVAAMLRQWQPERVCADATGLGGPLVARLSEEAGMTVTPVVFSGPVKSALGYSLIAAAETGRLSIFRDDDSLEARNCRSQLRSCRAHPAAAGGLRWGDDLGHDDYPVALALCLRAAEQAGPARVALGRRR